MVLLQPSPKLPFEFSRLSTCTSNPPCARQDMKSLLCIITTDRTCTFCHAYPNKTYRLLLEVLWKVLHPCPCVPLFSVWHLLEEFGLPFADVLIPEFSCTAARLPTGLIFRNLGHRLCSLPGPGTHGSGSEANTTAVRALSCCDRVGVWGLRTSVGFFMFLHPPNQPLHRMRLLFTCEQEDTMPPRLAWHSCSVSSLWRTHPKEAGWQLPRVGNLIQMNSFGHPSRARDDTVAIRPGIHPRG